MSSLFKYTVGDVESHLVIRHIVEVKYDAATDKVLIHLVNGSVVEINSKSEELYDTLIKKLNRQGN
jgi:hypothetical protein